MRTKIDFDCSLPFEEPIVNDNQRVFWLFHEDGRKRSIDTFTVSLVDGTIEVIPFR